MLEIIPQHVGFGFFELTSQIEIDVFDDQLLGEIQIQKNVGFNELSVFHDRIELLINPLFGRIVEAFVLFQIREAHKPCAFFDRENASLDKFGNRLDASCWRPG